MKAIAVVLLTFAVLGAWAADADTEEVSQNFASSQGMIKAHVVQSVKVFLNPKNTIPAQIVKHLPSHDSESEEEQDNEHEGNVYETSNFEAEEVLPTDSDSLEATASSDSMQEAEVVEAEPRFAQVQAQSSQPLHQLKQQLMAKAAEQAQEQAQGAVPDVMSSPLGVVAPATPAAPKPVMDEVTERASHLYIGYEDPNHLPEGGLTKAVDTGSTVGTKAGTAFDEKKGADAPTKKCSNGCQVRVPVMVGYVGVKEAPADATREVRMPGDRQIIRQIHEDLNPSDRVTWAQEALDTARAKLAKSSRRINKLRVIRKAYEDTALNREVPLKPWQH